MHIKSIKLTVATLPNIIQSNAKLFFLDLNGKFSTAVKLVSQLFNKHEEMKKKVSVFLKQVISSSLLSSIAKVQSMVVKGKMNASKAKLITFTLMKRKTAACLGQSPKRFLDSLATMRKVAMVPFQYDDDDYDDKYPDLTHFLFDEKELELATTKAEGGSIIEIVKNSKEEGEDFSLEDEIDQVSDSFITRFYKQMRLQKLLSFGRHHRDMLERSV